MPPCCCLLPATTGLRCEAGHQRSHHRRQCTSYGSCGAARKRSLAAVVGGLCVCCGYVMWQAPELARWLSALLPEEELVVESLIYLDGAWAPRSSSGGP